MIKRCSWCLSDSDYIAYHDNDWGVPVYDNRMLFEMMTLEGAQAGLSWLTVLKRRENYKKAFDNFEIEKIISYTDKDVTRLLDNRGIIRNRLKVKSVIKNARAAVDVIEEFGSLSEYLWSFVEGNVIQNTWRELKEIPASTPKSDAMSKALKKRGFSFVGSTICYAYMQSVGMVNDHITECFRHSELS